MDYDTYKLMTPEEDSSTVYANVEVELGAWITRDEYKEITITLRVSVEDDWDEDKGDIIVPSHINEDVLEYINQEYPECEYDLLDWKFV